MLKKCLVITILFFSNAIYLHASSTNEDVVLKGNEERIAKGIFSHVLKLAPADHTSEDLQRLTSFRIHVQNTLMTKKFNSSETSEEVAKAKEALENIRTNLKEQTNLCTVISSFLRDLSYATVSSETDTNEQRKAFISLIASIKLEEINAFYGTKKLSEEKACTLCHFTHYDRKKVSSTVRYSCSLCGLEK